MAEYLREGGRISAGFLCFSKGEVTPYGYSVSLNVGVDPGDKEILNKFIGDAINS